MSLASGPVDETKQDGRVEPVRDAAEERAIELEERTSAAVRGLFGRDSLYVLLWGLQIGAAALLTPVFTRVLGRTEFGEVAVAVAVMQVLVVIAGFSLFSSVQREYSNPDGPRRARRMITLSIVVAAITCAVALLSGPQWSSWLRLGPFSGAVPYAVAWASLTAVTNATLGWLRSESRLRGFAVVSLIQSVGAALLSVVLVVLVHATAAEFVLGQMIAQGVAVAVAVAIVRPLVIRRSDLAMVLHALRYSGALVPAGLATFGLEAADRLIVQQDLGPGAVARYAIANNIGSIPIILLGILNLAWMPRLFALADREAQSWVVERSRDLLYVLLVPVLVGLAAGAPVVLSLWAPSSFSLAELRHITVTVSVSALPVAGLMSGTRALLVTGDTVPVAVCTIIAGTVNIVLNILLVPPLGIEGSAISLFIGYVALDLMLGHLMHRRLGVAHLPRSLVAKCAVAVGVAAAFAYLPADAPFMALRLLVTAAAIVVFAAVLIECTAPGRVAIVSRLARASHLLGAPT